MREIEDWTGNSKEDESEESKINQKQKIMDAKGKEVSPDYFLFSCLEHERTIKAQVNKDEATEVIQWPSLDGEKLSAELSEKGMKDLLRDMAVWYRSNFDKMNHSAAIDHEMLHEVCGPLVAFSSDIDRLYRAKTGDEIPDYGASFGNNMIWENVEEIVNEQFGAHGYLFFQFIQWSHAAEPEDRTEPGSRPPVGRHAPRFNRNSGGRGGSDRGGPRGGGGGRDRDRGGPRGGGNDRGGPRGGGNDRGGARAGGRDRGGNDRGGPRAGGGNDRGGPRAGGGNDRGGPRGGGRDRDRGGRGGNRERGPRGGKGPDSAQLEEAALMDVYKAVKTLEKDGGVEEVTLKPTNSFYRRLQHQKAVEAGFNSHSVGEGHDRAVCVAKKNDD